MESYKETLIKSGISEQTPYVIDNLSRQGYEPATLRARKKWTYWYYTRK